MSDSIAPGGPLEIDPINNVRPAHPRWMQRVLMAAAAYNIAWGAAVVLFPSLFFSLAGLEPPRYLPIWQCVGMMVGVYGIGYGLAARDPVRHWPIVLVGLLGKMFGPIGFVWSVINGDFPASFVVVILFNDLIWWWPFAAILWFAASERQRPRFADGAAGPDGKQASAVWTMATEGEVALDERTRRINTGSVKIDNEHDIVHAMQQAIVHQAAAGAPRHGEERGPQSLLDLTMQRPQLIVFLRHLGCTFCREALDDVRRQRDAIEAAGVGVVLVHMTPETAELAAFLAGYELQDVPRVSDPQAGLYRTFELRRGSPLALFGPRVWWRGLVATLRGHRVGSLQGDGFQMPGAFVVYQGRIVRAFRHQTAADRPDYASLSCNLDFGAAAASDGAMSTPAGRGGLATAVTH